jgi:apolipoprotein D and lipocalin family protein
MNRLHLALTRFLRPPALLAGLAVLLGVGCARGPVPETVSRVDLDRYVGRWYEIASNAAGFNDDLVDVTADYAARTDGQIDVLNRGIQGAPGGAEQTIEGVARVVDTSTNAKLGVRFPSVLGGIFEGEYWIVALGADYGYAVVTDSLQYTLFVLSRTPTMAQARYQAILDELAAKQINTQFLRVTVSGGLAP